MLIVPAEETITVPPAETKGWYPNPSVELTETITPPTGIFALLGSNPTELALPVNEIEVPPPTSDIV